MGSLRSKSAFILTCALLLGSDSSFAANNTIHGVDISGSNNDVVLNVVSQNQITAPMKPTKAGGYYNIVIPNTTTTPNAACVDTPLVETCRITTVPTTDGSSYTKIQVKVPAGVGVRTMNTTNINDYSFGNQEFTEEYEQDLLNDLNADQSFEEEEFYEEENFEETAEDLNFEENTAENFEDATTAPPAQPQLTTTYKPSNKTAVKPDHGSDLIWLGIGALGILLICMLIYYAARDKVQQQMGDMDIDISDTKKKKAKENENKAKAKPQKTKKEPKPRYETIDLTDYAPKSYNPPIQEEYPFPIEENEPYIDIDSLYVKQTPITYDTPAANTDIIHFEEETTSPVTDTTVVDVIPVDSVPVEEEGDIDDFLSSFVDKDDEEPDEESTENVATAEETIPTIETENTKVSETEEEDSEGTIENTLPEFNLEEKDETPELETNSDDFGFANPDSDFSAENDLETSNYEDKNDDNEEPEILSVEDLLEGEEIGIQNSFAEDAEFGDEEELDSILNNPIENLLDDVLATEGLEFSDADMEFIQKQLQVDVTPELLDEFRLTSQQTQQLPTEPLMTLEKFDEENPRLSDATIDSLLKDGVKFNNVDTQVIHDLMTSFEVSEESVTDARIRKEQEDQANIDYYQNEADFAFTLVKSDENSSNNILVLDENYYPDLENVDFSGDAILNEFTLIAPEKPNYTDELDLSPALTLEELLGETEPAAPEETYNTEYQEEEKDDYVELEETTPEISTFMDEIDSTAANSTSIEDIEEQFRALGLSLNDDVQESQNELGFETSINDSMDLPDENSTIQEEESEVPEPQNTDFSDFSGADAEISAKCTIDDKTELYITKYEGNDILVGMKNDIIKPLYKFPEKVNATAISARITETLDNKTRYIVRANKFKSVIEVSDEDIEMVLVL